MISDLNLLDIPFSGRQYTWSNIQDDPLLIKLDWVLVSSHWGLSFPATVVQPLSKPVSDHTPFVVSIGSKIPKSSSFRFENFWVDIPGFLDTINLHWNSTPFYSNAAKTLAAKFKQTRIGLRKWSRNLSNLNKLIFNSNWTLSLLDGLEDQRSLSTLESAFRSLVKNHLNHLLDCKQKYWKQRNTIRWVTLGDENSSFQAMASQSRLRKYIGNLTTEDDILVSDYDQKATILWNAFTDRLGTNDFQGIHYDLPSLLQSQDFSPITAEFSYEEIESV